MNCPSRTDNVDGREGWNQNPNVLEGTTREDFNDRTNARLLRRLSPDELTEEVQVDKGPDAPPSKKAPAATVGGVGRALPPDAQSDSNVVTTTYNTPHHPYGSGGGPQGSSRFQKIKQTLRIYGGFIGPGFMVSIF